MGKKKVVWHCSCKCGNVVDVISSELLNGKKQNCGCIKKKKRKALHVAIGDKYGRLTVIERLDNYISPQGEPSSKWKCLCECGNTVDVLGVLLLKGTTKSCGCLRREKSKNLHYIHGSREDRLYDVWVAMNARCYNLSNKDYIYYGGRGIKVCEDWTHDYTAFKDWAYKNGFSALLSGKQCSLDRIDVNKDYSPENCRWVDMKTQCNNKRNNRLIEYNGQTYTIPQWASMLGLSEGTLRQRIDKLKYSILSIKDIYQNFR